MIPNIDCVLNLQRTIHRWVTLTEPTMANRWPQMDQRTIGMRRRRISPLALTKRKTLPLKRCNRRQQRQLHEDCWQNQNQRSESRQWNSFLSKTTIKLISFRIFFLNLFLLGGVLCIQSVATMISRKMCTNLVSVGNCGHMCARYAVKPATTRTPASIVWKKKHSDARHDRFCIDLTLISFRIFVVCSCANKLK